MTGTLVYYPSWWIILEVDYELGRYLRHLFFLAQHRCLKLGKPSRSEHVTVVIASEYNSSFNTLWYKYRNEEIFFEFELTLGTNGNAHWVPIFSKRLDEIRTELGLGEPYVPLHFALGYEQMGKAGLTSIA